MKNTMEFPICSSKHVDPLWEGVWGFVGETVITFLIPPY